MINREFDSLTKLDHPLIAELLEVYLDQNFVYFVSPFYTGGEIHDLMFNLTDKKSNDSFIKPTPLSEEQIKPIIYQILRALNYLKNNNLIHRDLKPENVMLESYRAFNDEKSTFIKIIDFGYSLDLNADMSDS